MLLEAPEGIVVSATALLGSPATAFCPQELLLLCEDRARQEADRVARARTEAYDTYENGDGDKDRSEK
jgi:hypothetical protein